MNHNKHKSTNHSSLPQKSSSNIKPPSSNQITTSNSFYLLSKNTDNSFDANNVISVEESNADSYSNKSNKLNNTSLATEKKVNFTNNRKKQQRTKDQIDTVIVANSVVKNIYGLGLLIIAEKLQ